MVTEILTEYCDKCGNITIKFPGDNEICSICNNNLKIVPDEYLEGKTHGLLLNDEIEQKLINDLVITSPNFDADWFQRKDKILEDRRKRYDEKRKKKKAFQNEQSNIPKCPTCSSTDIKKISMTSKAVNTAIFGLFGTKRHKTFHCNNCNYEW